ncbi:H(+)-transporting V0 sector ATPase subunit e [Fusarium falciforme]|nr:H(+)-transporting V0 sector ATPase subunit e [Fusarium falciforme]
MAQGYAVFIGLVVIAALCVASWFLAPKGENQVSVLVSAALRSPSPDNMTSGFANAGLLQALAVIADSRHRELLPDVGHHLYGSAAPPD